MIGALSDAPRNSAVSSAEGASVMALTESVTSAQSLFLSNHHHVFTSEREAKRRRNRIGARQLALSLGEFLLEYFGPVMRLRAYIHLASPAWRARKQTRSPAC